MDTIELTRALIRRPSITPEDAGCQQLLAEHLDELGFDCEHLRFGEVDNLWALRPGRSPAPLFVFAGHTDVVPTGPEQHWTAPPFGAEIRDGLIYGRGAADMKGSLAAMLSATRRFLAQYPEHRGAIGFLITSDEEGPARDGTLRVVETLQARGQAIDWCLVGEPTSTDWLGDTVKNGRRGSLGGRLHVQGKQGHIAYPHLAHNPVHAALAALDELTRTNWDQGNEFFPPTSFQISNIHAGTGAVNVIPGELEVLFNLRFSTESSADSIRTRIETCLDRHGLDWRIEWNLSGHPFLTPSGALVEACQQAVHQCTGRNTTLSTSGGTSDGRFIAPTGAQVVELGPLNRTIHQIDECVAVDDLRLLEDIYLDVLTRLLVH